MFDDLIEDFKRHFTINGEAKVDGTVLFLTTQAKDAVSAVSYLRDIKHYTHLVLISVADFIEEKVFVLSYILHNYSDNSDLILRVDVDRDNPEAESIHHLWAQAAVYQREIYEMFGIVFPGSPRMEEELILEGWKGIPPMRRDFDTKKYSEETFFPRPGRFTEDPRVYMEKNYPVEAELKKDVK